jgi:hypothetical protein
MTVFLGCFGAPQSTFEALRDSWRNDFTLHQVPIEVVEHYRFARFPQ